MLEGTPEGLMARLKATSYAMSLPEDLRDISEAVYDLAARGATDKEIDAHIHSWMKEREIDFEHWRAQMDEEFADAPFRLDELFNMNKLWQAYGIEPWLRECIRSLSFTDEPTPFLPFAAGYWIEDTLSDPPVLVAVMTPLTDPKLAAKQLVEKHRKVFGAQASGSARKEEVDNARMLAMKNEGFSYTDIAYYNLRKTHPDIVQRPDKYRAELKREKERVAKAVAAARRLWKERGVESSTPE